MASMPSWTRYAVATASPSERVGTKNRRVTLEAPGETISSGEPTIPWTVQATVWAEMEGLSGSDRTGIVSETSYRFTIWYRSDITPRWRLGLSGSNPPRKFQIFSLVDPDGRRDEQVIIAQEMIA